MANQVYNSKHTGKQIDDAIDAVLNGDIGVSAISNLKVVDSVENLPSSPASDTTGYIVGTHLYVYVGTGGDTADGKYQDCGEFKGDTGDKGDDGVGFASASSPSTADGTWQITLTNGDTITINLNHAHPQYLKYELVSALPASPDSGTLYLIAAE